MENSKFEQRTRKPLNGSPNPIIQAEERSLVAAVDKALSSSTNSQTIGANGEVPLRSFFNRYLPYTLRVATGHFQTPSGKTSPQLDLMLLDSRYPLLSENSDGSVLAMLHAVVGIVECKTRIRSSDVKRLWSDGGELMKLASEVKGYAGEGWGSVALYCFAYRSCVSLNTLADRFFKSATPDSVMMNLFLLQIPARDHADSEQGGAILYLEGPLRRDMTNESKPTLVRLQTPLSDLYYAIVQEAYYCLDARGFSFGDIGGHVMSYMTWSTMRTEGF